MGFAYLCPGYNVYGAFAKRPELCRVTIISTFRGFSKRGSFQSILSSPFNDLNGAPVLTAAKQSRRKAIERFERIERVSMFVDCLERLKRFERLERLERSAVIKRMERAAVLIHGLAR
jgi:hypothetical protein